jgi:hypothetical protein
VTLTYLSDDEQNDNPLKTKFVINRQRAAIPLSWIFVLGQVEAANLDESRATRRARMAEAMRRLKAGVNDFTIGELCAAVPNKGTVEARLYGFHEREEIILDHRPRGPPGAQETASNEEVGS